MSLRARVASLTSLIALCALLVFASIVIRPSVEFPLGQRVDIPLGTSLVGSARILADAHVVRSAFMLQLILIARFGEAGVKAGTYQFDQPLSVFDVARAILSGSNGVPLVRVTIPEGLRNTEIDELISSVVVTIAPGAFMSAARDKEGYLFPETYDVSETFTATQFVTLMEKTFQEKIASLQAAFSSSARARADVVTMASILEREGKTKESMRLIAGILWKRIDQGIPLQVDASFSYLLGKKSEDITLDDLKMDSPYNTYRNKGLPPTPLNNPGLAAIEASLSPTASPYLYYLTAPDGTFHYAQTFKEHSKNKKRYLK